MHLVLVRVLSNTVCVALSGTEGQTRKVQGIPHTEPEVVRIHKQQ